MASLCCEVISSKLSNSLKAIITISVSSLLFTVALRRSQNSAIDSALTISIRLVICVSLRTEKQSSHVVTGVGGSIGVFPSTTPITVLLLLFIQINLKSVSEPDGPLP